MQNYQSLSLLLLFLISFSCSFDPVITQDDLAYYYVESIISPAINMQGVLVCKVIPENLPNNVSGADVWMEGAGQKIKFAERKPGIYIDEQKQLQIEPGELYSLTVQIQEKCSLVGSVRVPSAFAIKFPTTNDTLIYSISRVKRWNADSIGYLASYSVAEQTVPRVIWQRSANTFLYVVSLVDEDDMISVQHVTTIDTSCLLPDIEPTISWWEAPDSMNWVQNVPMKLRIIASDSGQFFSMEPRKYWYDDPSRFRTVSAIESMNCDNKRPNMHGHGGWGYFGASNVTETKVTIQVQLKWP